MGMKTFLENNTKTSKDFISDMELANIEYFITGSRAFGVETANSDIDIVVNKRNREDVDSIIEGYGYPQNPSEYNDGYTFIMADMMVNIIPLIDVEYRAWKFATNTIKNLAIKESSVKPALERTKIARIALFENARSFFKQAISL